MNRFYGHIKNEFCNATSSCYLRSLTKMNKKLFTLSTLSVVILLGCDPCRNLDCISSNIEGRFRFSNQENKNLLYGEFAVYDSIRFYSINGSDTTFYSQYTQPIGDNFPDSILHITFNPPTNSIVFIDYDGIEKDTLDLTFHSYGTECCGTITNITNFRYNNQIDLGAASLNSYMEIKK